MNPVDKTRHLLFLRNIQNIVLQIQKARGARHVLPKQRKPPESLSQSQQPPLAAAAYLHQQQNLAATTSFGPKFHINFDMYPPNNLAHQQQNFGLFPSPTPFFTGHQPATFATPAENASAALYLYQNLLRNLTGPNLQLKQSGLGQLPSESVTVMREPCLQSNFGNRT